MIKKTLLCIYLLSFINIYTEEPNRYKEILEHTFSVGKRDNDLKMVSLMGGGPTQPSCVLFDFNDNLMISDTVNHRILVFNTDYTIKNIYYDNDNFYISSLTYLKVFGDYIWGASSSKVHLVMDKKNSKFAKLNIDRDISSKTTTKSIFIGNILFSYLNDGSICSFVMLDVKELLFSDILLEDETRNLFNNKEKYSLKGYTLDDNNRLLYKGVLLNRDYETNYQYWKDSHLLNNISAPRKVPGLSQFDELEDLSAVFVGEDDDGNTYWDINQALLVVDKNGWPLDYFFLENLPVGSLSINSKGDVYYLSYAYINKVQKFNLYKIKRQW